ncbi:zinc transporter ZIP10 isoform X3 [Silurus meridionalis]|nr:zinc transporter ZIP10 isoform X3 [Silurus meridionalis]
MRVHAHTKFCFLCVFTLLFHQCTHCHESGHHHHHHHHHHSNEHEHDHDHDHDRVHDDHQISMESYVGPPDHPVPVNRKEAAEQEQHYYIQQLFRRYGKQDLLDFGGFQDLLLSLGLGEVRVVELDHDNLGHDHVAHLDLLEVQKGLHSHSGGTSHTKHSNHHHDAHEGSSCSPSLAAGTRPTVESKSHGRKIKDGDHHHDHDHDHDQNADHDHIHEHSHEHDHNREQNIRTETPHHKHLEPTKEHTTEQETNDLTGDSKENKTHHRGHHHHHHHKHPHPHHHHHAPGTTDQSGPTQMTSASLQLSNPEALALQNFSHPPTSTPKRTRRTQKGKGQTNPTLSSLMDESGNVHNHNHDQHHKGPSLKEKRAVPEKMMMMMNPNTSRLEGMLHQHEECLNLTQLLHHYGMSPDLLISPAQFTYLCPALLYQIDSRLCIRHYHQVEVEEAIQNSAWVWVWGFVSITVISLLSLLGVVLVPILNQSCFKFLLTFLVALAVGTLSGDALLHLLPHSHGSHDHSHGEHEHEEEETDWLVKFDGVWKGLTALAGIYLLFIIEHCIRMVKHYKDHGGGFCRRKKRGEDGKIGKKLSDHKLNRRSDAEWMHLKRLDDASQNDTLMTEAQPPDSPSKTPLAITDSELSGAAAENSQQAKTKKHSHGHGHSHHGHCHTEKEMKDAGIASIAWMVIMGDGMHNFSDGLAIGAAFSANVTGGISTSVAVFCHELPHELGDFAVLLKAGMTVKQAIVYNLLSALMAYFGMVIGMAVGQYTHNVTSWIFAVTAGMFLYVALVDMMPEMLHGDSEDNKSCQLGHFVLQNVGMLTGFGIMLLIAIFEDRIKFNFD